MKTRAQVGIVVTMLAAAVYSCANGDHGGPTNVVTPSPTEPAVQTVNIGETEYRLDPPTVNLAAPGTFVFHVTNSGTMLHSLQIDVGGTPARLATDLSPGQSGDLTVTLAAGSYQMLCPIDQHAQLGMIGTINVASAAAGVADAAASIADAAGNVVDGASNP